MSTFKSLGIVVAVLAVLAPAASALPVQLVSVTVSPDLPTADQPVSLLATLYANNNIVVGRPTVIFDPTSRWFNVDLAAFTGPLPVVTTHVEDIPLGYLDPGLYRYTVTQHSPGWDQSRSGEFFVDVPEPAALMLLAVGGAAAFHRRRPPGPSPQARFILHPPPGPPVGAPVVFINRLPRSLPSA